MTEILYTAPAVAKLSPALGEEDKNMNNENRNEEAVSPVIATILMVAITVVLAGVLYVWASSLADDSTGGGLDTYQFSDRDAAGAMSSDGGDDLVHVAMTQGGDLAWALLKVTIVVDSGAAMICDEASAADATSDCTWATDGDNYWSAGEEITISEGNATDICGADGGCFIDVLITKMGVGDENDHVIGGIQAYADDAN